MNCLWCDQEIISEIGWGSIFILSKPKKLCEHCDKQLTVLAGNRCQQCSRVSMKSVCSDCVSWSEHVEWRDVITFNYSVFLYNEQMKKMISKWKYRGDYILVDAFKQSFIDSFNEKFSTLARDAFIVPIPLSNERLDERGFNQSKALADFLPVKNEEIITRIHSEKQSKRTRRERISSSNPFEMNIKVNKPVILVDDIYTTGATLRHAAALLKENGCPAVYAYTLARG